MEKKEQLPFLPINQTGLKKALGTWHVWALAVGLVISGEYFGWNYGWGIAGTVGFFIATVFVTILYIAFTYSYTELTCMYPHAGGPYAYAYKAFGPVGGLIAGYATLLEFVFAPPAIALAIGSYLNFLNSWFDVTLTAIAVYGIFTLLNIVGVKTSANFALIITVLAIIELLIYLGIVTPHSDYTKFFDNHGMSINAETIMQSLPYAIWFYLGIEGAAMASEEVKNPKRTYRIAYTWGIATLAFFVFAVMIITGSLSNWEAFKAIDHPLPEAMASVLGTEHGLTVAFAGLGLFGLIASFHTIIIAYSREIYALGKDGYLPKIFARINNRFQTPAWALLGGGAVGVIAILMGQTATLIVISVLGAVVMYIMSMLSMIALRIKAPNQERPFRLTWSYPLYPVVAILFSLVCLYVLVRYNLIISCVFAGLMIIALLFFFLTGGQRKADRESFTQ